MKQKLAVLLMVLCLICGCGGSGQPSSKNSSAVIVDPNAVAATEVPQAAPAVTEAPAAEVFPEQEALTELAADDPYTFMAGDVKILPRMEAATVLEALGTPALTFEQDSCAYQGKDIYYKYNGFELTVNEPDGVAIITAISVVDDTIRVSFPSGTLAIGDSEEKLLEVLGGEAGQEQYNYHSAGVHLQVSLQDGKIRAILFLAPEEY